MAKPPKVLLPAEKVAEAAFILTRLVELRAKIALFVSHVGRAEVVTVSVDHPEAQRPMLFVIDPDTLLEDMREEESALCVDLRELGVAPPDWVKPQQPEPPFQPADKGAEQAAAVAEDLAHA